MTDKKTKFKDKYKTVSELSEQIVELWAVIAYMQQDIKKLQEK